MSAKQKVVVSAANTVQVLSVMRLALRLAEELRWNARMNIVEQAGLDAVPSHRFKGTQIVMGPHDIIIWKDEPGYASIRLFGSVAISATIKIAQYPRTGKLQKTIQLNYWGLKRVNGGVKLIKAAAAALNLLVTQVAELNKPYGPPSTIPEALPRIGRRWKTSARRTSAARTIQAARRGQLARREAEHRRYMPGGPGFVAAKARFEALTH